MAVQTQIQTRRGTAASWTSTNPTLAAGEIGFETDTGKFKIGNGSTAWAALAYSAGATAVTYLFNATSGQTTFSGADANGLTLAYTVGAEQVYLNGVLQVRGSDYTATNGTSIVLASGALTSDVLNVIAYSAMTITDTYTQAQADAKFYQLAFNGAAGKNAVINGGMDIWQRGTSVAGSTTAFSADRWQSYRGVAGSTFSRQVTNDTTNLPNIQYCLRVQRDSGNTATTAIALCQNFETINSIPYAGKTVTLSFYARAGANFSQASSTLPVILYSGTGTDQNTLTGYAGQTAVITGNAVLTTTWQRFTYTGTVATSATELAIYAGNFVGVGTAGANDYYEITGVQLELGSIATPFARAGGTIAGELAACQRYFYNVNYQNTTRGTYNTVGTGFVSSATNCYITVTFPVSMRIAPGSVTFAGPLAIDDGALAYTVTNVGLNQSGANSTMLNFVSTGMTIYRPCIVYSNGSTDSRLSFSAEL